MLHMRYIFRWVVPVNAFLLSEFSKSLGRLTPPFGISFSEVARHNRGTMRFCRGDIVVRSEPYAQAVDESLFKSVCSGCLREKASLSTCAGCGHLRYCSKRCQVGTPIANLVNLAIGCHIYKNILLLRFIITKSDRCGTAFLAINHSTNPYASWAGLHKIALYNDSSNGQHSSFVRRNVSCIRRTSFFRDDVQGFKKKWNSNFDDT